MNTYILHIDLSIYNLFRCSVSARDHCSLQTFLRDTFFSWLLFWLLKKSTKRDWLTDCPSSYILVTAQAFTDSAHWVSNLSGMCCQFLFIQAHFTCVHTTNIYIYVCMCMCISVDPNFARILMSSHIKWQHATSVIAIVKTKKHSCTRYTVIKLLLYIYIIY